MVKNLTGNIWSGSEEENPGLWSSYKVFVPYCTSDVFSGRRDSDEESARFTFHGKYVVEAVVDDLLTEVFKNFEITQFVFMGASAGLIVLPRSEPQVPLRSLWCCQQLRLGRFPGEKIFGRC